MTTIYSSRDVRMWIDGVEVVEVAMSDGPTTSIELGAGTTIVVPNDALPAPRTRAQRRAARRRSLR